MLRIEQDSLEDHVKRVCKNNLRRDVKICEKCPILGPVIDIMEKYNWRYNKETYEEHIQEFYARCKEDKNDNRKSCK